MGVSSNKLRKSLPMDMTASKGAIFDANANYK